MTSVIIRLRLKDFGISMTTQKLLAKMFED